MGQPEVKLLKNVLWLPNLVERTSDQIIMHAGVKTRGQSHAGVIRGQTESNCLI